MAANGRGTMRPQSRSPPFLVIGLLVALIILGANYWSLSSNNSGLALEISELQDTVRQLSAKRISAEKKVDSIAQSYNKNKDTLAKKEEDVKTLNQQIYDKNEMVQKLGKEKDQCQESMRNCEENSNGIQQELQKVKEELEQLKTAEKTKTDPVPKCDEVCAADRKLLLSSIEKTLGINSLAALHQAGVDVGEYKDKVASLSKDTQQNEPQDQNQQERQPQRQADQNQIQGQAGQPAQGEQPQGQADQQIQPQTNQQNQPQDNQQVRPQENQQAQPQDNNQQGQEQAVNPTTKESEVDISSTPKPGQENTKTDENVMTTRPAHTSQSTTNASISGPKDPAIADKDYNQVQPKNDNNLAGMLKGQKPADMVNGSKPNPVDKSNDLSVGATKAPQSKDQSGFQIRNLIHNFREQLPIAKQSLSDVQTAIRNNMPAVSQKTKDLSKLNDNVGLNATNITKKAGELSDKYLVHNVIKPGALFGKFAGNDGGQLDTKKSDLGDEGHPAGGRQPLPGQIIGGGAPTLAPKKSKSKKDPNYDYYEDNGVEHHQAKKEKSKKDKRGPGEEHYDDEEDEAEAVNQKLKFKPIEAEVKAQDDSIDKLQKKMDLQIQQ